MNYAKWEILDSKDFIFYIYCITLRKMKNYTDQKEIKDAKGWG